MEYSQLPYRGPTANITINSMEYSQLYHRGPTANIRLSQFESVFHLTLWYSVNIIYLYISVPICLLLLNRCLIGFFTLLRVCEAMGSDIYFLQVLACLPVFLQD